MPVIAIRCPHCGWSAETESGRLPAYGARVRCAGCGSLMALCVPPAVDETPASAGEPEAPVVPSRSEARQVLELWIREIRRTTRERPTEKTLREGHREELARLQTLWQASFPGPESARVFEEELRAILRGLPADDAA